MRYYSLRELEMQAAQSRQVKKKKPTKKGESGGGNEILSKELRGVR